ncbi:hypothetical protein X801_03633 [Opisthorchis viverrini]|uniref:Uncharacterized protein n=1 Tax=Opisthorchis viverrini TaxID=6198 RepID=A0A1S8X1C2_OPIVI|nr:hypothetical protein X801_03633 [Opisthorchis viverrini]
MEAFEVQNVDTEAEKFIDNRRRRLRSLFDKETKQQMYDSIPSIAFQKTQATSEEQNMAKCEEPVEEVESEEQIAMAKEAEKLEQQQKRLKFLQDQLEELNQRENEADHLVEEENQLTRILARLDKLELQLRALEDKYKQGFSRRAPLRQHNATLRRRSTAIQSELKSQLEWLERFVSQCTQGENSEDKANSEGVEAVRKIVEADLEKEKKFVLELDILLGWVFSRVHLGILAYCAS